MDIRPFVDGQSAFSLSFKGGPEPSDFLKFTQVPKDSRVLSERRLWFLTTDRLKTWLILSGSSQQGESAMVWPNLPPYHRFLYFVLLFSTKTAWQRGSQHYQRFYGGNLRQTMVDLSYCLDQISEGRSQVSRRSEVGNTKRRFGWGSFPKSLFLLDKMHPEVQRIYRNIRTPELAWTQDLLMKERSSVHWANLTL